MNPNRRQKMLRRLRDHLSYANVVATLALFIALGGSSYAAVDLGHTAGRRLPTHNELRDALTHHEIQLAPGGELTSDVYPSSSTQGELDVLYVTDQLGHVALTPDTGAGAKAFRCAIDPS